MHLRPTSRAALVACAVAALSAVAPTAANAAATGSSTLTLFTTSGAGKALRSAGVKVRVVKPATVRGSTLTLPTAAVTLGTSPTVRHAGAIRFVKGKRKVTFTSLRTSLGTAPAITGAVGGKRVTLFTLKGGTVPQLDPATGTAVTSGTSAGLTAAAARRIKTGLKLRRLAAGALGRATVKGTDTAAVVAPKQPAPAPAPAPAPIPAPKPAIATTKWVSSTLPGDDDHASWINYITTFNCMPRGSVALSGGITPVDPANTYDFLVEQVAATPTTVTHQGRIRYVMGCHDIDQWMENLRFTDLDKPTGTVIADGFSSGSFMNPAAPDFPYRDLHVLDLDLDGAGVSVTTDPATGARTFANVPATVSASAGEAISYAAGRPWGFFTFTVPAR